MTYRDSDIATNGSTSANSVQVIVPATVEAGDVLLFSAARSGTNGTVDISLSSSNGGSFSQAWPVGGGLGSLSSVGYQSSFVRTAIVGDAGSTVTASTVGVGGRWVLSVIALSGVSADSLVATQGPVPGTSSAYIHGAATPASGSTAGDVVRVAYASNSTSGGLTAFAAPDGHTLREEAGNTGGSGQNLRLVVATSTFTGGGEVPEATSTGQSTSHRVPLTFLLSGALTPGVTATAPADLSRQAESEAFALTGSAAAQGGATVTSRAWTVQSGTSVTLADASTDTVTITPPSGTGSTVLRYTVNGSSSTTAFDDVTITWTAAATDPITYDQTDGVSVIDGRAFPGATTLTQTGGSPAVVTEPVANLYLVSGPGVFVLSDDADVEADAEVIVVAMGSGSGGLLEELVFDGTDWV